MTAQVAADLRAAADVLRRDGWTQMLPIDNDGCRCATGALAWAATDGETSLPGRVDDEGRFDRWLASVEALRAVIGDGVVDWNDTPGRTADEVIAALEAAADAAERQAAYDEGRWCGECQYGVAMDPPCCTQGLDEPQSGDRP